MDVYFLCMLARAHVGQRRTDETLVVAQQALDIVQQTDRRGEAAMAWRTMGIVLGAMGQGLDVGVRACFEQSAQIMATLGHAVEHARCLRDWARYELLRGDAAQGQALWQQALDEFTALGVVAAAERMHSERRAGVPEQPS